LRACFVGEHLLLRSLSCNGRVVMLMMADQGGGPFSETTVQAFGKTAQCIEKALHCFTTRGLDACVTIAPFSPNLGPGDLTCLTFLACRW
jgi:hypothetical protein